MVDYVECIDWVTTLTITPKPGAGGSSPSTPANLEHRLYKGFKGLLKNPKYTQKLLLIQKVFGIMKGPMKKTGNSEFLP